MESKFVPSLPERSRKGDGAGVGSSSVTVAFACQQCGAGLAFSGVRTETCPYCASPSFIERPACAGRPDPAFAVAFTGDARWARDRLVDWLGRRSMFADPALRHARVEDLRGVYLPAYLYSAVARSDYTAQIGEHYTEVETKTTRDEHGNKKTETRSVTRTEYRALSGQHVGYITDVLISASAALDQRTLAAVEPFDLRQLRRWTPALVSGWIQEEYSRDADECSRTSRAEAIDAVGDKLRAFMPGDSYSDLSWRTAVEWESLDPIVVPIWVFAVRYRDDKDLLRVVINGQTGRIAARVPLAWWKIAIAVGLAFAVVAAILYLVHGTPA